MYDKELKYNFYNILAVKSGVDQGFHFNYEGRANEPNIILSDNRELKKYICKNIYLFSNNDVADGEMIIENECITNYGKKIYLRILLNTERMMPSNEIDKLFEKELVEIDLNSVLQDEDDCVYTETADGILITFKQPVNVHSKFKGLANNPIFTPKNNTSLFEGFEVVVPDASGVLVTYDVSGDSYMECDNLPIDAPVVPTYSVDVRREYDNRVSEVIAITSISIFFIIVAFLWFLMDSIYKFIFFPLSYIFSSIDNTGIDAKVNQLKMLEGVLLLLLILLVMITPGFEAADKKDVTGMYSIGLIIFGAVFIIIANHQKSTIDLFGVKSDKDKGSGEYIQDIEDCRATWSAKGPLCDIPFIGSLYCIFSESAASPS